MLKQCYLLLKLLRELRELVLCEHILLLIRADGLALIVVEACAFILCYDLGRVIEEDTC